MPTRETPSPKTHLRFWWYEGDAIHYDAPRYAELRGITVEEAEAELKEILAKLLPDTPITVQDSACELCTASSCGKLRRAGG